MNPGQKNLKAARAKIEKVLRDHDIAGYVSLHAPNAGEVFWQIWPSYSLLQGDVPEVRLKSKVSDRSAFGIAREQERRAQTAQMVHALAETLAGHAMVFLELATFVNDKLGAVHEDKGFTPDSPPEASQ